MHSPWFRSTFCRVLKFLQIKEGGSSCWGNPILGTVWIICLPVQCFNFKSFMDPNSSLFIRLSRKSLLFGPPLLHLYFKRFMGQNSSSFIRFQCILPNFCDEPILQIVLIISSPLLYFNFKSFLDPISFSFVRFQCILHDWGVPHAESWNF